MDVDCSLQKGVGGACKHDCVEDLYDLTTFRTQDGRAEDPVRFGIDHELHQPGRLVALDGAGDPGHRDLADLEPSAWPGPHASWISSLRTSSARAISSYPTAHKCAVVIMAGPPSWSQTP